MATLGKRDLAAGAVENIVDTMSLSNGVVVQVQNRDDKTIIRYYDGGTVVPDAGEGKDILPYGTFTFTVDTSVGMWVRAINGKTVVVADSRV